MELQRKKCLFLVQGEGHGHMTQSVSMKQVLEETGMEVCEVIIGKSSQRQIPEFYLRKMKIPVTEIESPNMYTDKRHKAVKPFHTFIKNVLLAPRFIKSLKIINQKIKEHKPDIIINFFEPLCGVYCMIFRPQVPIVSIGHHFMFLHSGFNMPKGRYITNASLKIYIWLTGFGSKKRLALSFYPFSDDIVNSIYPVPPLLRNEVLNYPVTTENYLLVYLLNNGYMEDIINWHKQNPETLLHCFTDRENMDGTEKYDETLYFHKLDDKKFLEMMASSKGVVTTSGFESVCEAMYMGKPVFMVPVQGQYEQFCNSRDAIKTCLGLYSDKFDIGRFLNYLDDYKGDSKGFSDWVEKSHHIMTTHILDILDKRSIAETPRMMEASLNK